MAHEVETMAYANQVPWHGLGANVNPESTIEEMLEAAGLNWQLERKPLLADMGDDEDPLEIEGKAAWVRNTDRKVMAVAGKQWRPLQPADTLGFMRDYVEAGAATLETAGSLREGKIVWGLARLKHDFEVRPGDRVNGYLLITSPNEVGRAITVRTTTVRVVCANTMAMAERGAAQYRQNHLTDFDVAAAKEAVGNAHEQLAQAERNARILDRLKLSASDAVTKVLAPVFFPEISEDDEMLAAIHLPENQPKKLQQILASVEDAPGNKEIAGTGWAIINGVTHWADHVYGHNAATRMMRSWNGDNANHKLEVERRLLELAA